jgi:hypothetical protein
MANANLSTLDIPSFTDLKAMPVEKQKETLDHLLKTLNLTNIEIYENLKANRSAYYKHLASIGYIADNKKEREEIKANKRNKTSRVEPNEVDGDTYQDKTYQLDKNQSIGESYNTVQEDTKKNAKVEVKQEEKVEVKQEAKVEEAVKQDNSLLSLQTKPSYVTGFKVTDANIYNAEDLANELEAMAKLVRRKQHLFNVSYTFEQMIPIDSL